MDRLYTVSRNRNQLHILQKPHKLTTVKEVVSGLKRHMEHDLRWETKMWCGGKLQCLGDSVLSMTNTAT